MLQARAVLARTPLIAITPSMVDLAGVMDPVSLRTLDALHLAGAVSLGNELDGLVTYDNRLAEAARLMGIDAFGPA
jgi:predicted nucleic acid-binding protein